MKKEQVTNELCLTAFGEDEATEGQVAQPEQSGETAVTETSESAGTTASDSAESAEKADAAEIDAKSAAPDKSQMRAEFEKLIKGDYKEFYEERIKENLSRRFRENAQTKEKLRNADEIVSLLCTKYDIKNGDIGLLKEAIESDDAYLVSQADKRGMAVEDLKYIKKLESENRRFHEHEMRQQAEDNINRTVNRWFEQSEQAREVYPDFDIFAESRNPSFVALLKSGIDAKTAYEVVHHSEIIADISQSAAREAEQKTADAIRQRAARPAENGLSSPNSVIIKSDVSKLSASQRADIARRAARGETITF